MIQNRRSVPIQESTANAPDQQERLLPCAMIREEAQAHTASATRYTFVALMFTGAALGAVIPFLAKNPILSLVSIPLVLIISAVRKMVLYKHITANRNHGFELFAAKIHEYTPHDRVLIDISWEQAMRAWRVVQPVVYKAIYKKTPLLNFIREKSEFRKINGDDRAWYRPASFFEHGTSYDGKTYIESMMRMLHFMMLFAAAPAIIMGIYVVAHWQISGTGPPVDETQPPWHPSIEPLLIGPVAAYLLWHVLSRWIRDVARVRLIEKGLFSIHASSILWHAVAKAHRDVVKKKRNYYRNYMKDLGIKAQDIADRVLDIHSWFEEHEKRSQDRITLEEMGAKHVEIQIESLPEHIDPGAFPFGLERLEGEVLDVSVDGSAMGLMNQPPTETNDLFEVLARSGRGTELTLNLLAEDEEKQIPLKGVLQNIAPLEGGKWRMGVSIEHEEECHYTHCRYQIDAEQHCVPKTPCRQCANYLIQDWCSSETSLSA